MACGMVHSAGGMGTAGPLGLGWTIPAVPLLLSLPARTSPTVQFPCRKIRKKSASWGQMKMLMSSLNVSIHSFIQQIFIGPPTMGHGSGLWQIPVSIRDKDFCSVVFTWG